jgi:hypothetical protein
LRITVWVTSDNAARITIPRLAFAGWATRTQLLCSTIPYLLSLNILLRFLSSFMPRSTCLHTGIIVSPSFFIDSLLSHCVSLVFICTLHFYSVVRSLCILELIPSPMRFATTQRGPSTSTLFIDPSASSHLTFRTSRSSTHAPSPCSSPIPLFQVRHAPNGKKEEDEPPLPHPSHARVVPHPLAPPTCVRHTVCRFPFTLPYSFSCSARNKSPSLRWDSDARSL